MSTAYADNVISIHWPHHGDRGITPSITPGLNLYTTLLTMDYCGNHVSYPYLINSFKKITPELIDMISEDEELLYHFKH